MERTFGTLRFVEFRYLTAGTLAANLAEWANRIGTAWLVYDITGSATQLGTFAFVSGLMTLAATPIAGMLADRFPRTAVVILSSIVSIVLAAIVAALVFTDMVAVWHVYLLGSLAAVSNTGALPARQALVNDVTTPELLPNAVALNTLVMNVARLAGPPLFGVLAATGNAWPFVGIVILQTISAAAMYPLRARIKAVEPNKKSNPARELADGVRYVYSDRTLLSLFLIMFSASIIAYPYLSLLPVFAEDVLDAGATGYGLLFAMAGVGSIIGLLILPNLDLESRRGITMFVCYLAHLLGIAVFSQMTDLVFAMAALFVGGIFIGIGFGLYYTLFQLLVRDDMRGRALSVAQMANLFFTIGALPMGLTISWVGIQDAILLHVLAACAVFALLFFVRPEWRRL